MSTIRFVSFVFLFSGGGGRKVEDKVIVCLLLTFRLADVRYVLDSEYIESSDGREHKGFFYRPATLTSSGKVYLVSRLAGMLQPVELCV